MDVAQQLDNLLEQVRQQSVKVENLRQSCDTCCQELAALRECLVDTDLLSEVTLLVKLHRHRFQATIAAHPLGSRVPLEKILGLDCVGVTIGRLCGWVAAHVAGAASPDTRAAILGIGQALRACCSSQIYVCGGMRDGVEVLDTAECFNTESNTWEAIPHMLERRCDASAHVIARRIYVCGGCNGEPAQNSAMHSVVNSVERFDPFIERWEAMPSMLFRRKCAAAGVIAKKLYLCGGFDGMDEAMDLSECFEPRTSATWEALPLMLEPRAEPAAGVLGQRLFVCGGRGPGVWSQLGSTEVFNPADGVWQPLPPMLEPRSGAAAATVGEKLFVYGGMGNCALAAVESFDARNGHWEAIAPGPAPRYGAAAAAAGNWIYIFGGLHSWQHSASADCFDPVSNSWWLLPCMSERRMAPAAAASPA